MRFIKLWCATIKIGGGHLRYMAHFDSEDEALRAFDNF